MFELPPGHSIAPEVFFLRQRDPIRVLFWGLGEEGRKMADLTWRRPGMMPVGAIDSAPDRVGHDLGDLIGFGQRLGLTVNNDPEAVLASTRPDVTLIATGGGLKEVSGQIRQAMEAGSNVICIAPEMIYPWASDPDLADRLDDQAHAYGVTVLGTGVNPGFVLDTLVIALTGCCLDVERIRASRVIGLDGFGREALAEEGVGLSPSRFMERRKLDRKAGLAESIHLIADALGWRLDRLEEQHDPIIAEKRREVGKIRVEPGQVAGTAHAAIGFVDGLARIVLEHPQQFAPEAEALQTGDFIEIEGKPNIHLSIQPGIAALEGSVAIAVNMIPAVLQAGPGLMTMADLPVPRAVLGDLRDRMVVLGPTIEEELARGWHDADLGGD